MIRLVRTVIGHGVAHHRAGIQVDDGISYVESLCGVDLL